MANVWLPALGWWVAVTVIGWAAAPLAARLFARLPDRGYAFSRPLGLLLAGYAYWLLVMVGALPNQRAGAIAVVLGLVLVGAWQARRHRQSLFDWLAAHRRLVVGYEVLGLVAFLVWTWYKSYTPAIEVSGGEKYMEMAFISAVLRSPRFPPLDPWLSGYAISYYHFAYIISAFVILVSGVAKTIGFNLIIPLTWAMTLMGAFGLGYNLVRLNRSASTALAATTGALAALLLGVVGSLEGALELAFLKGWGSPGFFAALGVKDLTLEGVCDSAAGAGYDSGAWIPSRFIWWWRGSRVIRDDCGEIIHEFPFFSFMLGDNHPHVLALPYVLLVLGLALCVLAGAWHRRPDESAGAADDGARPVARRWSPRWLALPLAVGALGFLNTWDLPTYGFIVVVAYALAAWRHAAPADFEPTAENQGLLGLGMAGVGVLVWRLSALLLARLQPPNTESPAAQKLLITLVLGALVAASVAVLWRRARAGQESARRWLDVARFAVWLASLAVLFYLPFYVGFSSQASGLGVVALPTQLGQWLVHFGLLFFLAVMLLAAVGAAGVRRVLGTMAGQSIASVGVAVLLAAAFRGALVGVVLAACLTAAALILLAAWSPHEEEPSDANSERLAKKTKHIAVAEPPDGVHAPVPVAFALLCVVVGCLLPLGTEFVFIGDIFNARMNTMFKLYYQAWTLLSIAGAYGAYVVLRRDRLAGRIWLAVGGLLIVASLYYPLASVWTRTDGLRSPHDTLDGLAWWQGSYPDDLAAARWLEEHVPQGQTPVLLQASGGGYQHTYRLAMATGLPTVLGSDLHEWQWRGDRVLVDPRIEDVKQMYQSRDEVASDELLDQYGVRFVAFGEVEKSAYNLTEADRKRFERRMTPVFTSGSLTIFERPESPAP